MDTGQCRVTALVVSSLIQEMPAILIALSWSCSNFIIVLPHSILFHVPDYHQSMREKKTLYIMEQCLHLYLWRFSIVAQIVYICVKIFCHGRTCAWGHFFSFWVLTVMQHTIPVCEILEWLNACIFRPSCTSAKKCQLEFVKM